MSSCYVGHRVFNNQLGMDLFKSFGKLALIAVKAPMFSQVLAHNYHATLKSYKPPKQNIYRYLKSVFQNSLKIYKC